MCKQSGQRLQHQLAQPLAFGAQPLLECLLVQAETREQFASVQFHRLIERAGLLIFSEPFEARDVHVDAAAVELQRVAIAHQPFAVSERQRLAEVGKRAPQAAARLFVGARTPQQFGDLVAGMRLRRPGSEVGQERPSLLGRKDDQRTRPQPRFEATEQTDR
jgi:hypothetical protein